MEKIGIILINYKDYAKKFLSECRDSLYVQNYHKDGFKVYIVDNASSAESRNYLKETYPEAVIVPRSDGNYSAANNEGILQASKDGCNYFVIANMDTKFDKDWLGELVKAVKENPGAGMIQSKILLYPKDGDLNYPKINTIGNIINYLGFGFTDGYKLSDKKIEGYPEIIYASGCSFIVSKKVLDRIGGYDENYYMYHDDTEMGLRARLAGYKNLLAPKSIVYHKYEFSRSVKMVNYMERNRILLILHYYKWRTILLILPALIAMDILMILYSIKDKSLKTKLNIYLYFLSPINWLRIYLKRARIKKIKNKKDKDIMKDFEGRILFQEVENPALKYIVNPIFNLYWKIAKKLVIW